MPNSRVRVGGRLTIVADSSVMRFSLIRYGSVTHTVDTDQRRLAFDSVSGTNTWVPSDPGAALPGYWMSFAIDGKGVPSIARTVKITPGTPGNIHKQDRPPGLNVKSVL
ncbi:uncharacterized protein RAG0_10815 [Rhynchosporium agropyri]|uniref:Galactose oxidase-like Early set domain-containing protein n=1 Tax=Rhynchosporium agropyri TaxID=914238 RepID=A0A1E1L1C3_9HELO|nr:uncharacterized protein RAG0_10815 [Rhynchosporium agropyri]